MTTYQSLKKGVFEEEVSNSGGKILSPARELIDQFAEIMEYAIGSLLIQKMLITISASKFFKILVSVLGLVLVALVFLAKKFNAFHMQANFAYKLFLTFCCARFFFVLVFGMSTALEESYVRRIEIDKLREIEDASRKIGLMDTLSPEERIKKEKIESELNSISESKTKKWNELDNVLREIEANAKKGESLIPQHDGDSQMNGQAEESDISLWDAIFGSSEYASYDEETNKKFMDWRAETQRLDEKKSQLEQDIEAMNEREDELREELDDIGGGLIRAIKNKGLNIFDSATEAVGAAADAALELTIVFIFKAILMPLFFMWCGYLVMQRLWGIDIGQAPTLRNVMVTQRA
ncbi:hypothetical protein AAIA72_11060 [Hahella sp. SMD15-11]|uniref:DUF4407 domain-containing protein n=1 Tax=Thermohahella caldifontis TaxID=3142973 RepID=A0AB39UTN6_9GAMM